MLCLLLWLSLFFTPAWPYPSHTLCPWDLARRLHPTSESWVLGLPDAMALSWLQALFTGPGFLPGDSWGSLQFIFNLQGNFHGLHRENVGHVCDKVIKCVKVTLSASDLCLGAVLHTHKEDAGRRWWGSGFPDPGSVLRRWWGWLVSPDDPGSILEWARPFSPWKCCLFSWRRYSFAIF